MRHELRHASSIPWICRVRSLARPPRLAAVAPENRILPMVELERQTILSTIAQLNGDKLMAAKLLGIGKTTLYRKLKEYGAEL